MSALDELAAKLRERFPFDDDRRARLARGHRGARLPQDEEGYYLRMAAWIADSFLDRLNDYELGMRVEFEAAALLEEGTDERKESLRLAGAEVARREKRRESPPARQGAAATTARQSFALAGTFRIYFNRHQAAPLVWCIATDTFELAVAGWISEVPVHSVYINKEVPDHEDGKPSAWLEVTGVLLVTGSDVRIAKAA
jgi:hypothetical protein